MNFLTKIKDFFKSIFTTKTELSIEIQVEEKDLTPPTEEPKIYHMPVIDTAPEEDEHVPSKTIRLEDVKKLEDKDEKITVKEIKSKSRTKKEKEEIKEKDSKDKKSKKKAQ